MAGADTQAYKNRGRPRPVRLRRPPHRTQNLPSVAVGYPVDKPLHRPAEPRRYWRAAACPNF